MVASICSKERSDWDRLIADTLPVSETNELTEHLAQCESCRQRFESLCAEESWWRDSSETLRVIQRESGVFSTEISKNQPTELHPQPRADATVAKGSPLVVIAGLKPSQEPNALGDLDDYTVREVIGYGGMGTVLKAWDKRLSRVVAIKVLHPHLAHSSAARTRFSREAQAVASISHPNVVPVHDVANDDSQPYIVMGFVPGGSLQDKLDQAGPLSLEESLKIALQIAEGLEAAHSHGLVHRDIKPANILLEARWNRVLITDFGLARALDDATITASGHLAGTPQFMSPEQALGKAVDHRSDLYSLGSVLYNMLTGRAPFRGDSAVAIMQRVGSESAKPVYEIQDHLPFWAHQLVEKLHVKDPHQRVSSAVQAADLIRNCLHFVQNPSQTTLPRGFAITRPNVWRAPRRWTACACVFLLIVAGIWFLNTPENRTTFNSSDAHATAEATASQATEPSSLAAEALESMLPPEEALLEWRGSVEEELQDLWIQIDLLDQDSIR